MASYQSLLLLGLLISAISISLSLPLHSAVSQIQTYIVHVSQPQKPIYYANHHHWYASILRSLPSYSSHPPEILYIYSFSIGGFSARLTDAQSVALRLKNEILSVVPDGIHHPHTTLTPTFLNLSLSSGIWHSSVAGDGVIVGVLDTGVWPEHRSFSLDNGISPVPSTWKGICEVSEDFPASSCNKKLVGARAYYKGYFSRLNSTGRVFNTSEESLSPRDTAGHGTHTASTVAGSEALEAGLFGYAMGKATGMAPKAHVAAYKICWSLGCFDSDILAAMDQSIEDGVHVISLSVGASGHAPPYDYDSIAIGAFGATAKGVIVSCSAGNSGPGERTATNIAPWIITVGASTIDREFPADVILGDGSTFTGSSLYAGKSLPEGMLSLIYGGDAGSRNCVAGQLKPSVVEGKIVICDRGITARVEKGNVVRKAGGVGMVLINTAENGEELVADSHLIPAAMVGGTAGSAIKAYAKRSTSPTATILFRGTVVGGIPASPRVAAFSSRGPNSLSDEVLKPDVVAPGVNILAAWTGFAGPSGSVADIRRVEFNIISGTSMSCPHVSGLAALLRKAHPEWSPAAIKSALMTTAYNVDKSGRAIGDLSSGKDATAFGYGAGHVDPNKALDPGLIYDMGMNEYVDFLCASGYSYERIAAITQQAAQPEICGGTPGDLNYPAFSVVFTANVSVVKYKRMVTNVGTNMDAVYEVKVNAPEEAEVKVSPEKLIFSGDVRRVGYEAVFRTVGVADAPARFGSIEWSDGIHRVRSPFAVQWRRGIARASI